MVIQHALQQSPRASIKCRSQAEDSTAYKLWKKNEIFNVTTHLHIYGKRKYSGHIGPKI